VSLVIDLGDSAHWLDSVIKWPSWLTAAWISDNRAQLICRLSNPDDYANLRKVVPTPDRLIAYPVYQSLEKNLSQKELALVHETFVQSLGAQHYVKLTPEMVAEEALEGALLPQTRVQKTTNKRRLALVSPMPPTASGIANYCIEILPALAEHYDVTLVVDSVSDLDAGLTTRFTAMSHAQFFRLGACFDRIMYHFGNSSFHYEYFTLLQAHPGVVVLHDIYLGDCIFSNFMQLGVTELYQKIYISHGWAALLDCQSTVQQSINLYPACGNLFNDSYGVLVHSEFAKDILSLFFDATTLSSLCVTPLARKIKQLPDRTTSRQKLNIPEDAKVYATFGFLNPNKYLNELLEAWAGSRLAHDATARLYLIGGCGQRDLKADIITRISKMPLPEQIILTGFVGNTTYDDYLSAVDISIQLRCNSRGESSAAVLDSMAAELTTIINSHGSMAEIPDATVIKLHDEFTVKELIEALNKSAESTGHGSLARSYVEQMHSPEKVVNSYVDHMESCYRENPSTLLNSLQRALFTPKLDALSSDSIFSCLEDLTDLMSCAGGGTSTLTGRQLLVDISAVVRHDLKSGIQRVVRNILSELLKNLYLGFRVEAVYFDFACGHFRYARTFVNIFLDLAPNQLVDDAVEARSGDIYLGLDFESRLAREKKSRWWLQTWRGRGVAVYHVLYDLIPIQLPHCFPSDHIPFFENWISAITNISDGVVSISRTVANEYEAWLNSMAYDTNSRPRIGYFHLGAEMESRASERALEASETRMLKSLAGKDYLLMVGTVEPRKGYGQVLKAFEILWSKGFDIRLVIVGSEGWIDKGTIEYLKELEAKTEKVQWLNYVSDAMLKSLYEGCAGTLMASFGEGFGLPLIEAAHYGASLIVRDLPIFHEVCGDHAWYFQAQSETELASALQEWLNLYHASSEPKSLGVEWQDWQQSTAQLIDNVIHNQWYVSAAEN
jgi:glycosyltransferase involved in cell wall biosynthesis